MESGLVPLQPPCLIHACIEQHAMDPTFSRFPDWFGLAVAAELTEALPKPVSKVHKRGR